VLANVIWHPEITGMSFRSVDKVHQHIHVNGLGNVTLVKLVQNDFGCSFNFEHFPSDRQACSVAFASETASVDVLPGTMLNVPSMAGYKPVEFTYIKTLTASENKTTLHLDFSAKREASPYLISVLMPTILLEVMTTLLLLIQAIPPRVMCSVISSMILFNKRTSVIGKLPGSANAAWMEEWFMFNLVYAFVLFTCFVTNWDSIVWHKVIGYFLKRRLVSRAKGETVSENDQEANVGSPMQPSTINDEIKKQMPSEGRIDAYSAIVFLTGYTLAVAGILSERDWS